MTNNGTKHIWIFNHYAVIPDFPGGTRHFDFAQELAKRGHTVTVFAANFLHQPGIHKQIPGNPKWLLETINHVNFIWLRTPAYQANNWRRLLNMTAYAEKAYYLGRNINQIYSQIQPPDVIIGSTVHLLTVLAAAGLAKKYRAKFIIEIRDLWPRSLIDIGQIKKNSLAALMLSLLEKYLYPKADHLIVLSANTIEYLKRFKIPADKITVIPNGVNLDRYPVTDISPPLPDNGAFKIIYAGSLNVGNALKPAVQAAKIIQEKGLKQIEFIIIGQGAEKSLLISLCAALGLINVSFHEPVSKAELPSILATADALLLIENNILYGSSNKLMDYLASAKPLIYSTYAAHLGDVNCGIAVPPQDAPALAEAVIKLYSMTRQQRKQLGRNGRNYAETNFTIPVLVDKLEKVLILS